MLFRNLEIHRYLTVKTKQLKHTHTHLSHEFTLFFLDSGLVPNSDLQHALSEVSAVDVRIQERLVPFWVCTLLHRFRPSLALVTRGM